MSVICVCLSMRKNIQFNYLYRDSANYKNFGSVIFHNDRGIQLKEVQTLIKAQLIDDTWFYANQWGLPDLHQQISEEDPTWHEFESISYTHKAASTALTLPAFLSLIQEED